MFFFSPNESVVGAFNGEQKVSFYAVDDFFCSVWAAVLNTGTAKPEDTTDSIFWFLFPCFVGGSPSDV